MKAQKKINVSHFLKKKEKGEKIVALTAYDAPTAKLAEECGVDLILVGDSMGMTMLGYKNTIPVTLEQSLHHSAAVRRGAEFSFIVGDMPFMTYQISPEQAMQNAARYLQEAMIDAVKLEGGEKTASTVERLVSAGVPVLGHIGLLPQNILTSGGYRITGKTQDDAERLVKDALALEKAGAFAIVLEGMSSEAAAEVTHNLKIPTIGIGAGPGCDGQVQVINDLLGLFTDFVPKHAKKYCDLSSEIRKALTAYTSDVKAGVFPGPDQSF
ncbi:MAG: 3-methyl-2-oxobutanoate hydroxymethyltransferase [Lentisphaerae bacterium GWF2_45_14]|nr:MAG: 3-methyl-2-oxobutanoate hydroxymethyltransferase [Lentisphaerae bacterium GWF2_45_14]